MSERFISHGQNTTFDTKCLILTTCGDNLIIMCPSSFDISCCDFSKIFVWTVLTVLLPVSSSLVRGVSMLIVHQSISENTPNTGLHTKVESKSGQQMDNN